jgi:hypothetical protein
MVQRSGLYLRLFFGIVVFVKIQMGDEKSKAHCLSDFHGFMMAGFLA